MKSVKFPEANCPLGEDQPQYETLHVFVEEKEFPDFPEFAEFAGKKVPWSMTACFELSPEETEEFARTGKIWLTQMVMGNRFQPIRMSTQNPFVQP